MAVLKFDFYKENDGTLQYSNRFFSYTFETKSTYQSQAFDGYPNVSVCIIPIDINSTSVFAFYSSSAFVKLGTYFLNNTWQDRYMINGPIGTLLERYEFTKIKNTSDPAGSVGFRAYHRDTQELAFSSTRRTLIFTGSLEGNSASFSIPSGKKYAAVLSTFAGRRWYTWEGPERDDNFKPPQYVYTQTIYQTNYGVLFSGSSVTMQGITLGPLGNVVYKPTQEPRPSDGTEFDIPNRNTLLVDVTGL